MNFLWGGGGTPPPLQELRWGPVDPGPPCNPPMPILNKHEINTPSPSVSWVSIPQQG